MYNFYPLILMLSVIIFHLPKLIKHERKKKLQYIGANMHPMEKNYQYYCGVILQI
jgi:hypothetical protein